MVDLQSTPQPHFPPVAPVVSVIPAPAFQISDPIPPKSKLLTLFLALIVIILLVLGSYFVYQAYLKSTQSTSVIDTQKSPKPTAVSTTLEGFTPMPDASELLVYTKNYDKEIYGDEEAILINPNTSTETVLPLKKINFVYKYYGSDLLFYHLQNDNGEYHILNLKNGLDLTYDLLDHSDSTVKVSIGFDNITEISPDGKYLVFNGGYFYPCPSPSPLPSGFEGGFGPCGPEQNLDNPTGYFLYDIESRKSTYLQADSIRISRWDMDHNKLYFVEGNSTKSLDLKDKTLSYVDSTSNFGYFTYPLIKKDSLVKFEGATGDSGNGPFGKINLVKNSDRSETLIDSTNTWTDIQPFIMANANETDVLYRRSTNINGLHRNSIYRYNLVDGKTTRVTKDDNSLSYSNYISWISDHEIVTSVDLIEEGAYDNQNQNLVKIDLNTLVETAITDHSQVMYFNTQ